MYIACELIGMIISEAKRQHTSEEARFGGRRKRSKNLKIQKDEGEDSVLLLQNFNSHHIFIKKTGTSLNIS